MIKLFGRAVFYKLVVHTQTHHARCVTVIGHPLQDCATQTTGNHAVLGRHDGLEMLTHFMQDLFVHRFQPPHIVMGDIEAGGFDGFAHRVADAADCQDSDVFSVP